MPLYPIIARAARIQGVVKIKVTTDGKNVTSADVVSGPPMLAKSAKESVLTWKFLGHSPVTFIATFDYEFEGSAQCDYANDALTLKLPLELRITAPVVETCDPAETKSQPLERGKPQTSVPKKFSAPCS